MDGAFVVVEVDDAGEVVELGVDFAGGVEAVEGFFVVSFIEMSGAGEGQFAGFAELVVAAEGVEGFEGGFGVAGVDMLAGVIELGLGQEE